MPPSAWPRSGARSRLAVAVAAAALGVTLAPMTVPARAAEAAAVEHPAAYVDPFIGTADAGNTFPGAVRPFGMLSWSPELARRGDATRAPAPGGYKYSADRVRGFSLTHVSATGCIGASGDIPILPFAGGVTTSPSADDAGDTYVDTFSHDDETAEAGYYGVEMGSGIRAELTSTTRTGSGRFTYPAGSPATMLVRTSDSELGSSDAALTIDPETRTISGSVTSGNFCGYIGGDSGMNAAAVDRRSYYTLYFTAEFDTDFAQTGTWVDGDVTPGGTTSSGGTTYGTDGLRPQDRGSGGWVTFKDGATVGVRVGISYVSPEGARANLAAENPAGTAFDDVRRDSWQAWDEQLGHIRVSGGAEERRRIFYTALYHALLHPNVYSDVDGRYRGFGDTVANQRVQQVREGQRVQYSTFSGWDVYRGQVQLLSWLEPAIGSDIATSLLNQAEQNGGVWDRWTHLSGGTHVMVGDPSPIALAGMHAFGATDFPLEEALDSLVRAATVPTALDDTNLGWNIAVVGQRPSLADYLRLGYYPSGCYAWGCPNETLEISVSEAGIAQLAADAGRHDLVDQFSTKAQSWQNQFNHAATPDGGWFQDRADDGSWVPGFDPASTAGFVEGTAAVYLWHVQHNPAGLISTLGGDEAATARLDAHFKDKAGGWDFIGDSEDNLHANMDNAPSIHVPYLYSYAGVPGKTAETVRAMLDTIWSTQPAGIPGNDDLGTMSAWYVFSAIGGYPVDPTRSELVLSAPVFPRVEITPRGGRPVTIVAEGADADGRYITGVRVNGENWTRSSLPEGLIAHGGTVELDLAATPSPKFGAAQQDRPTSQRIGEVGYRTDLSTPRITVARGERSDPVDVVATRLSGQGRLRIVSTGAPDELRVSPADSTIDVPRGQQSAATSVTVEATPWAAPGTYSVPIEVDVEDVPGAPHDGTQMLGLTVDVR